MKSGEIITIKVFPPTKIYALLNKYMRRKLINTAKRNLRTNNYFLARWLNKKSIKYGLNAKFNGGDVNNWYFGEKLDVRTAITHPKYMPLWIVLELSELARLSLNNVEKNIGSYRSGGSGKPISNIKFPIKRTPEFESIIFHIFGDGAAGNFTPSFFQKNKIANKQFLSKLKNCFGDFDENTNDRHKIRFPKAITDILSHVYKIESYHSDKIRVPLRIYKSKKLNKLACAIAFILDEGHIRDVINISSKNKNFLGDLKRLIESCGYKCQDVQLHRASNTFYLNLSNRSIEKVYRDYVKLIEQFPSCSLANKHAALKFIISRRQNKSNIKNIGKAICSLLKDDKLTTKQIAQALGFAHCTVSHHLNNLYKNGKINRHNNDIRFIWYCSENSNSKK